MFLIYINDKLVELVIYSMLEGFMIKDIKYLIEYFLNKYNI